VNLLKKFHDYLSMYYPQGCPCLFLESEKWTELCHFISRTKSNTKVMEKKFGNSEFINLPIFNVLPGSKEANSGFSHGYSRKIIKIPNPVIQAAKEVLLEINYKSNFIDDFLLKKNFTPFDINQIRSDFLRNFNEFFYKKNSNFF